MALLLRSAALITAAVLGQSSVIRLPNPAKIDTAHLTIATSVSLATVSAGGRVTLYVDVAPKPRMHVYAPEEKVQQPISLTLDRASSVTAGTPTYPKGEPFFFAPTGDTQIVYSQPFRIEVPVTVLKSQKPGALAMTGTFRYQACDDKVCYIAKSVPLTWEVAVR